MQVAAGALAFVCADRAAVTCGAGARTGSARRVRRRGRSRPWPPGADHSCALRRDGSAVCWGSDRLGQASPPAVRFTALTAAGARTCGVRSGGSVVCWGRRLQRARRPRAGAASGRSRSAPGTRARSRRGGRVTCWGARRRGGAAADGPVHAPGGGRRAHLRADRARRRALLGRAAGRAGARARRAAGPAVTVGTDHACVVSRAGARAAGAPAGAGGCARRRRRSPRWRRGRRTPAASCVRAGSRCWGVERARGRRSLPARAFTDVAAGGAHACALRGRARRSAGARTPRAGAPAGRRRFTADLRGLGAHLRARRLAGASRAGARTRSGSRARRAGRSRRSARAATTRARCRSAGPPNAGAPGAAGQTTPPGENYVQVARRRAAHLRADVRRPRAVLRATTTTSS